MFTFCASGAPLGSPIFISTTPSGGSQQIIDWINTDTDCETLLQYFISSTLAVVDFTANPGVTSKELAGIGYPPTPGDELRLWHRKNGILSPQTVVVF